MQPWAEKFYHSKQWHKCRSSFIAYRRSIDGGLCQECRDRTGYIVHHRQPLTAENINDPNITLAWSNLEYVCKDCHDQFEGHGLTRALTKKVFFDELGDPIPPMKRE